MKTLIYFHKKIGSNSSIMACSTSMTVVSCHYCDTLSTYPSVLASWVQAASSNYKDMESLFKRILVAIPECLLFLLL